MATRIRLKRIGRKNRPFYRVVVMDSRQRRNGAAIEELGWYNPIAKDKENNFELNEERIFHWLQIGAQPSDIAHKLMKRAGIAMKWHLMKQGLDEKAIEKEIQKFDLRREAQAKNKLEAADKESKEKAKSEKTELVKEKAKVEKTETKDVDEKVEVKVDKIQEKEVVTETEEKVEEKTELVKEKAKVEKTEKKEVTTTKKSTRKKKVEKKPSVKDAKSKDEAKDDK